MDITDFVKELNSIVNPTTENKQSVSSPVVVTSNQSNTQVTPTITSTVNKTIKVMIVSTHINQANGHSKVIQNVINELARNPWIKITHFGTQKIMNGDIGRKYPPSVKVIDGTALEKQKTTGFAFQELPSVIMSEKPDVVFILNDISVICGYIEEIRKVIQTRTFRIWAYVDMVYKFQPQLMVDILNRDVERVFCFTKFWKDELKSQGITRPVDVISHAVDPKVFRPIPRDLARQSLGLPKDIFLFTSLNKNIPRKRLDLLVMAFVKLIVRFPVKNIFMLIVADKGEKGGHQLFDIYARELKLAGANIEQFGNRLLITMANTSYKDEDINILYNCGDAGVSCAEGEGFGLCTFEQMSLGIPQIVPESTGYLEYCNENNSLMVKPKMRYYIPQVHSPVTGEAQLVDPEDVSKVMERYVFDDDLRKFHGKLGKEKVSEYTWEKCCNTLVKRLKALQDEDD